MPRRRTRSGVGGSAGPLLAVAAPGARSALPATAAVALARAGRGRRDDACDVPLIVDFAAQEPHRPALLASDGARDLAAAIGALDGWRAVPRGRLCIAAPRAGSDGSPACAPYRCAALTALFDAGIVPAAAIAAHVPAGAFRDAVAAVGEQAGPPVALIQARADGPGDSGRRLLGAVSIELRRAGVKHRIWRRPPGAIQARRALAGLDPGGETARRALASARSLGRADGQAVPAVLGLIFAALVATLALVAIGGAVTAKGRAQRAADLAALSAARSMRDDLPRLFIPPVRADGTADPRHLSKPEYEQRAEAAAREGAERNGLDPAAVVVSFPDGSSIAPTRVSVAARPDLEIDGQPLGGERIEVDAEAAVTPPVQAQTTAATPTTSGGGYSGPLAMRQGKPMRPDVADAFDRLAAVAGADGITLTINSGYRSDAEQARLFAANPDPRMVAPPGTSLHRCGTELDLGPSSAYGWLAANAGRFGFLQRYSWEAWHYGYVRGPDPCSAAGDAAAAGAGDRAIAGDGRGAGGPGLPGFVPTRYRRPLLAAAARHDVPAALLAAQLMAESNFNPAAVSSAGAQGIAQFMPATAAAYGLSDPFDAEQAIDAQARLMRDLLGQFGQIDLALAAYNAGPAPVAACSCVPAYPETQAYVARILALLDGAGQLGATAPVLEVRLVE